MNTLRPRGDHVNDRPQHSALDTRDDLLAIADVWPDLVDRLARESSSAHDGMPRAKGPSTGLVLNEHISDVMGEVRDWTWFLVRVLLDETDWTPPKDHDTPTLLTSIARLRVGHFTEHPDLGDTFADDATAMRRKVEHAAYPSGRRRVPLHVPCTEHTESDQGERVPCPGSYTATLDPERPGLIPDMVCDHDPAHRITPLEWQRAARKSSFDPTAMRRLLSALKTGA